MAQRHTPRGQASLTSVLVLIGLIVAAVWVWKNLGYDTQDFIVEEVLPVMFVTFLTGIGLWGIVRKTRERRNWRMRRERLITQFQAEQSEDKRLQLAFDLVELNGYQGKGLESVAPAMAELFRKTLKTALGDKQHRIRGMAASHLGAIQDGPSTPLLMKALEDDHAYVRSCAALALGRMRAGGAREKLTYLMKEDWDQTVRSRAREALERMG